jgi:diaminopimelate epimerase
LINRAIPVVKGHAYGNDFLLVPDDSVHGVDLAHLARVICHRQLGVGADGLITYSIEGDRARMRLFNADGSPSEVSGNGVRCLAALVVRRRPNTNSLTVETGAGPKVLELIQKTDDAVTFRAFMGQPREIQTISIDAAGERVEAVTLSVGNPQCVVRVAELDESRAHALGPALERHPRFPNRTNVSFVKVEASDRIRILIWERGVGPTLASGTGACGAATATRACWGGGPDIEVISPGGSQRVETREDGLYLTGWARLVFEGEYIDRF